VPSTQTAPVQEAGAVAARPLPYQLTASSFTDCQAGRFYITFTNAGTAAAHIAIYANAFRPDGPWQYDVPAGGSLSDYFNVALFGDGKYDLSALGPNGFVRRFAGDINTRCNQFETFCSLDPDVGQVTLAMRNLTSSSVDFTVTANAYLSGGPWNYSVAANTTLPATFLVSTNGNWYDFRVTTSGDTNFIRRFAGHIEPPPTGNRTTLKFAVAAGIIHFAWPGSSTVRLQQAANLNLASWQDVSGTVGASSADVPLSAGSAYFRLAQ
jgi:phospholipase C